VFGNFLYGVDIETGEVLVKIESPGTASGMVPGEVAALDLNLDGFLEVVYWADTEGNIYKIDNMAPQDPQTPPTLDGDGLINLGSNPGDPWYVEHVFAACPSIGDANGDGEIDHCEQPFFVRPTLVPVSFNADGSAVLAIVIGTGDRDDILEENSTPHRFYAIKDELQPGHSYPITEADMDGFDLTTSASAGSNFMQGTDSNGWFLEYTPNTEHFDWEKTNTAALVVNQVVIFSTFNPSDQVEYVPPPEGEEGDPGTCRRTGTARTYHMSLLNSNPPEGYDDRYTEHGEGSVFATEPVVYLGADGQIHIIQALDDLRFEEPMAAFDVPVRVLTWKEE
jgi:hypothetical protein